jgi:hypothetical protein
MSLHLLYTTCVELPDPEPEPDSDPEPEPEPEELPAIVIVPIGTVRAYFRMSVETPQMLLALLQ